ASRTCTRVRDRRRRLRGTTRTLGKIRKPSCACRILWPMRTRLLLSIALLLSAVSVPRAFAPAPPCVTPTDACTGWVVFGSGPARSMVYTSYPLGTRNDAIKRALIMVHGTNRNADHYFSTAVAAAFLAGALDDTIVIAPHLVIASDPRQP